MSENLKHVVARARLDQAEALLAEVIEDTRPEGQERPGLGILAAIDSFLRRYGVRAFYDGQSPCTCPRCRSCREDEERASTGGHLVSCANVNVGEDCDCMGQVVEAIRSPASNRPDATPVNNPCANCGQTMDSDETYDLTPEQRAAYCQPFGTCSARRRDKATPAEALAKLERIHKAIPGRWCEECDRWNGEHAEDCTRIPRELRCDRCLRDYATWVAPNALWNEVVRVPSTEAEVPEPFLCPTCFALAAETKGIKPTAWVLVPETPEMLPLLTGTAPTLGSHAADLAELRLHQATAGDARDLLAKAAASLGCADEHGRLAPGDVVSDAECVRQLAERRTSSPETAPPDFVNKMAFAHGVLAVADEVEEDARQLVARIRALAGERPVTAAHETSTGWLSGEEIAIARGLDKLRVDANGMGFVPTEWLHEWRTRTSGGERASGPGTIDPAAQTLVDRLVEENRPKGGERTKLPISDNARKAAIDAIWRIAFPGSGRTGEAFAIEVGHVLDDLCESHDAGHTGGAK